MPRYRFSLGDSRDKGFGVCFDITANTEDQAVRDANDFLEELVQGWDASSGAAKVTVYAGPNLTILPEDIDDVEDDDEDLGEAFLSSCDSSPLTNHYADGIFGRLVMPSAFLRRN